MTEPPDADVTPEEDASEDFFPAGDDDERGPNRRCIVTGAVKPAEGMIRFVVGPEAQIVPDVEGRLPGRGIWLSAGRDVVNTATVKNLFSKVARRKVSVPADLGDQLERQLSRRCLDIIGLARRAGQAVAGYEKVRGELKAGRGAVVLAAVDGSADGRDKIAAIAVGRPVVAVLRSEELGAAFGRSQAVHVVLAPGRLADRLLIETGRLAGFRAV